MQLVYSTGCVTAVGLNAAQTCSAVRAKQSGIEATVPQSPPNDPLLAARVPAQARLKKSQASWLRHLVLRAMRECLAGYTGDLSRLALFIALPEPFRGHSTTEDGTGHAFVGRLIRQLGLRFSSHSRVLLEGHSSMARALHDAAVLLERNEIDAALIGGVDSLVNDLDRQRLHESGRLHELGNPFGVIPGEAAAFVLTGRQSGPFPNVPMAAILGTGFASEVNHLLTDRYSLGVGLQKAIEAALHEAGAGEDRIEWRIVDLNGERHRTWESTVLLARQYRNWRDGLPCLHLPALTGDVGCASLPLQVIVGAHAMQWGYAPGPFAVCESSSEGPTRGACIVAPAPGARRPPFRALAAPLEQNPAAVIARQLERLPNELSWLAHQRENMVSGRHTLAKLQSFDERIEAHLALLRCAGRKGWDLTVQAIHEVGSGGFFAPVVLAIESGDLDRLGTVLAAAAAAPELDASVMCAFGWVPSRALQGIVAPMASAGQPAIRLVATAALQMHRAPPGKLLWLLLEDSEASVHARALRLVGEIGLAAHLDQVRQDLHHDNAHIRFCAAWSATLLGDRELALDVLSQFALGTEPQAQDALSLVVRAADLPQARRVVRQVAAAAQTPTQKRTLMQACAACGDPGLVPWLVRQMAEPALARLAGESFRILTGHALPAAPRNGQRQATAPYGDPDDDRVAMDPDYDLPCPDAVQAAAWWQAHAGRMPAGGRYFLGEEISAQLCLSVLKCGIQPDRHAAALTLAVIQPASGLFNTAAPAWRQADALAALQSPM